MKKFAFVWLCAALILAACESTPSEPVSDPEPTDTPVLDPLPTQPPADYPEPVQLPTIDPYPAEEEATVTEGYPAPETDSSGNAVEEGDETQLSLSPDQLAAGQLASEVLSELIGVNVDAITIKAVEAVEWPDGGLGCPADGMMYTAVITPGYLIELTADGESFTAHTDQGNFAVVCGEDGSPLE